MHAFHKPEGADDVDAEPDDESTPADGRGTLKSHGIVFGFPGGSAIAAAPVPAIAVHQPKAPSVPEATSAGAGAERASVPAGTPSQDAYIWGRLQQRAQAVTR